MQALAPLLGMDAYLHRRTTASSATPSAARAAIRNPAPSTSIAAVERLRLTASTCGDARPESFAPIREKASSHDTGS